jgi:hypothetical protein
MLLFSTFFGTVYCNLFGPRYKKYDFELLEFPFSHPAHIERMAAFGIPNWSGTEPHNGIDLIIYESLYSTRIISPTKGTVSSIEMSENPFSHPPNQLILTVNIYINSEWSVALVIEPGTTDETLKTAQKNAVQVEEDDTIDRGQSITDLLVGEHGYAHLHYMILRNDSAVCAYPNSSISARQIFNDIASIRINNHLPGGNICYGEGY